MTIDPIPLSAPLDFPAADMVRAAVTQVVRSLGHHPRSGWIRTSSRRRAGICFPRGDMLRVAIANSGLALNCLYAFFKSCKRTLCGAAAEIRTPRIILGVSAIEGGASKNSARDDQTPRHAGRRLLGKMHGP